MTKKVSTRKAKTSAKKAEKDSKKTTPKTGI